MIPQPRPVSPELRAQAQDPAVLAAANINPVTRLATDYLNHYNEVIMLLEMLESCPEFVPDIVGWEPRAYDEYFVRSHFKDRDLALVAWEYADPAARMELERLADHMNAILAATLDALRLELHPFGIEVVLLEPAYIRTNMEASAVQLSAEYQAAAETSPYAEHYRAFRRVWRERTRGSKATP